MRPIDADELLNKVQIMLMDIGCWNEARVERIIRDMPTTQSEQRWILCDDEMPDEDYWSGGSGKQFSENVLVTVANYDDDDAWTDVTHTVDGEWMLELPRHCEITAWMPLPKAYQEDAE